MIQSVNVPTILAFHVFRISELGEVAVRMICLVCFCVQRNREADKGLNCTGSTIRCGRVQILFLGKLEHFFRKRRTEGQAIEEYSHTSQSKNRQRPAKRQRGKSARVQYYSVSESERERESEISKRAREHGRHEET